MAKRQQTFQRAARKRKALRIRLASAKRAEQAEAAANEGAKSETPKE